MEGEREWKPMPKETCGAALSELTKRIFTRLGV
jgi:hypothetical protein